MSDYIYGSSLRAAKSKVNYLFEGDFRRRPNQNLSGASRSLARGELLQQAAEQRQNREGNRRKEQAVLKIQSTWRGFCCRRALSSQMRKKFDRMIHNVDTKDREILTDDQFEMVLKEFIIRYHSRIDELRFNALIDFILRNQTIITRSKQREPKIWLHRMIKLLQINLKPLKNYCVSVESRYLSFLNKFTSPEILNNEESTLIWSALIEHRIYTTLRQLIQLGNRTSLDGCQRSENNFCELLIELVRRSLEIEPELYLNNKTNQVMSFFCEFLKGPLDESLDNFHLPRLLKSQPISLKPKYILTAFERSLTMTHFVPNRILNSAEKLLDSNQAQDCTDAIWLCYSFVRTIYTQFGQLTESDKVNYIKILSVLIAPAEYVTNISLMQNANREESDQDEGGLEEEIEYFPKNNQAKQTELNNVITRLVNIINDAPHIDGLKSIIFNNELQPKVQASIIQICNLMLAHEPLAIFNCCLLYSVAFSREFSRSLWRSIIQSTSTTQCGTNIPIYIQLTRGNSISSESWKSILPQLTLFCSLYSYLLPTLDDEEFYTDDDNTIILDTSQQPEQSRAKSTSSSTFFIDKELVSISAILRDICVGFIEILYQDKRQAYHKSNALLEDNSQDQSAKLIAFEIKVCFKALVRLICQLHARDSRKQFCPNGHWICPSAVIPANKAIDFQLVTSQQGRLLSQMTKDDTNKERASSTASEIKTVLILQEIPFVISFHNRVQIFHQLLRKEKQIHQSEGYHFGLPGTAIQVQIRRNYIYEDAFEKLSFENEPNMKLPLKVSLINAVGAEEAGIDGGGLSKEFLGELLKAGFDPMRGFFKSTNNQLLYPNPSANVLFSTLSEGYEIHYEFLGRILGKAIFEKIMVELPLASFFLAKLLARKHSSDVDLHNLASLDPVLYKNLVYLKNYKGDVADLNLDFSISNNDLDEHEVVELKPGGSKIPVTRDNKIEYVHLVADYRLNKQIRAQCAAFKRGLAQLVDLDWLRMFDPRELQILISGAPTLIDTSDWRRNTCYANGYSDESEAINIFWLVVRKFDEKSKRKLLKFATSCSLPPLLGFKDLVPQFTIAPSEESRLPSASTCMNLLKLPACEDEITMRSKLLYAIESNSGFELS